MGIDWSNELTWLVAAAVVLGLVGVVLRFRSGAVLVGGAVLAWGLIVRGPAGWTAAGVALGVTALAQVAGQALAGRRPRRGGPVPAPSGGTRWSGPALAAELAGTLVVGATWVVALVAG